MRSAPWVSVARLILVAAFTVMGGSLEAESGGEPEVPGLAGGIPFVPVRYSVTDFGAVGDGITDDSGAIQAAVNALPPEGGAVFIPEGRYLVLATIFLKSGAVVRGSGAADTHLLFDLGSRQDAAFFAAEYGTGPWIDVIDGLEHGSRAIRVAGTAAIVPPAFGEIEQENDPDLMYTDPEWIQPWAEHAVGEVVRVIERRDDWVILDRPLNHSYRVEMRPRFRIRTMIERVGIEDLMIERLDVGDGDTIYFANAAHVWVRGVESAWSYRSHVQVERGFGCEIRQSYFHHAHDYGDGGHAYGVRLMYHTTSCLVEDNAFSSLRHAMVLSTGASGNVFGYNFSRDPISSEWWGYVPNDISVHGHYPAHNLFEGNVVQHVAVADYWGPAGPRNTLLRNCVQMHGIWIYDHSHEQRIIGNLLGGNGSLEVDPSVNGTVAYANTVGGVLIWDPDDPGQAIPNSEYLSFRPSFFGHLPWPPIGGANGTACGNPASQRWEAGLRTPRPSTHLVFSDTFEGGGFSSWSRVVE